MNELNKYLVCVRCYTYQQASYIEDALNGFCMQQTNFPYICIVVDDASTDGEQDVINQYLTEHFDLEDKSVSWTRDAEEGVYAYAQHKTNKKCFILSLNLKKNLFKEKGAKAKLIAEWRDSCKYEAVCEGDDYWTDPQKLQRQVDVLETHPEYSFCFHRADVYDCEKQCIDFQIPRMGSFEEGRFSLANYLQAGYNIHFNTLFYRQIYSSPDKRTEEYPFLQSFTGDTALMTYLLLHGDAYFIPDTMSVYRLFAKGSHNERKKKDKWAGINQYSRFIVGYRELDKVTGYQYHDDLVENIRWCLGFVLERALLLSYKECYDVLEKYYNHSPELEGMPQSHMLQRKQKLPFWLFFYLEKLRQWKNRK